MSTIYKPGDRVFTKINGIEVEGTVVKLSLDVEVKTPDGKVWWRSVNRVRPAGEQPPSEAPAAPTGENSTAAPVVEAAAAEPGTPPAPAVAEPPASPASEATEQPASPEAAPAQAEVPQPGSKRKRNRDRR